MVVMFVTADVCDLVTGNVVVGDVCHRWCLWVCHWLSCCSQCCCCMVMLLVLLSAGYVSGDVIARVVVCNVANCNIVSNCSDSCVVVWLLSCTLAFTSLDDTLFYTRYHTTINWCVAWKSNQIVRKWNLLLNHFFKPLKGKFRLIFIVYRDFRLMISWETDWKQKMVFLRSALKSLLAVAYVLILTSKRYLHRMEKIFYSLQTCSQLVVS